MEQEDVELTLTVFENINGKIEVIAVVKNHSNETKTITSGDKNFVPINAHIEGREAEVGETLLSAQVVSEKDIAPKTNFFTKRTFKRKDEFGDTYKNLIEEGKFIPLHTGLDSEVVINASVHIKSIGALTENIKFQPNKLEQHQEEDIISQMN